MNPQTHVSVHTRRAAGAPAAATPALPRLSLSDLYRSLSGRRPPIGGDMAAIDGLVAFSFGAGTAGAPARTNEQLAALTRLWGDLPVAAQPEVAQPLARAGRIVVDIEAYGREAGVIEAGSYVDTASVAAALAVLMERAGWRTVGVLAHPGHIGRCVATCQRLGIEAVVPPEVASLDFGPTSTQWWTRARARWMARETLVLAHQAVTGKL